MRWRSIIALYAICLFLYPADAGAAGMGEGFIKRYEYWPDGRKKSCSIDDLNNLLIGKVLYGPDGSVERLQKFDSDGNKVEESIYDPSGSLAPGIDGWAAMRWRYDQNRLLWRISYDAAGNSIERKVYNENGDVIGRQLHADESDESDERFKMLSQLAGKQTVIFYNPDGSVQSSVYIDR